MARQRSPNYPATDLQSAIADVRALYDKEKRTPVPPEIVVTAWGYKGLSGIARTRLASLRQYGLIEPSGKNVRVTERALTLIFRNPETREWQIAVKAAALDPEIFRELYEKFAESSDESIRYYLIRDKNFTHEGASRLIGAFRATLSFAKLGSEEYTGADGEDEVGDEEPPTDAPSTQNLRDAWKGAVVQKYAWALSRDLQAEVTLTGRQATPDDLDMLEDYLEVTKRALKRDAARSASETHDEKLPTDSE
jgi:hypothetical protein